MSKLHRDNAIKLLSDVREITQRNIDLKVYFEDTDQSNDFERTDIDEFCYGVSSGSLSELIRGLLGYENDLIGF